MASLIRKLIQFQQGFSTVVYRIFTSAFTALRNERAKYVFKIILISFTVIYAITIPIRISLFLLQFIMSTLSFSNLSSILLQQRVSITFYSIFMDSVWYIPLFILFLSRALGLFPTTPFDDEIMKRNSSFATQLLNAETKQNTFTGITFLLKRIIVLILVSMITITSRLIPGVRILISFCILLFLFYRKQSDTNTDTMKLSLISLSLSLLMSNWTIKILLSVSKLYLTSQALSREFMFPYFCKISFKMEEKDKRNHQWLLFGFGSAMTLCFAIPIFGLILYPVFQTAAVDILMIMMKQNKVSFISNPLQQSMNDEQIFDHQMKSFYDDHKDKNEERNNAYDIDESKHNQDIHISQRQHIAEKGTDNDNDNDNAFDIKMYIPKAAQIQLQSSHTSLYDENANIAMDDAMANVDENTQFAAVVMEEKKRNTHIMLTPTLAKKKRKKKKPQILYAEDATKLFKKINDDKRFKNGITLRKICNIFSVAWELPDEKGRLLPSKVVRHFKQVLPSKKTANTTKKTGKKTGNTTPSLLFESKANIADDSPYAMLDKAQTVRGHAMPNYIFMATEEDNTHDHDLRRSMMAMPAPSKEDLGLIYPDELGQKKSMVTQLECLIEADPNRSNYEDDEKNVVKRERAGSLADLELNMNKRDSVELDQEIVMENEIEQLIEEKKNVKRKQSEKEKEKSATNFIVESNFD